MRRQPVIEKIWKSGKYFGSDRADCRITIQPDWYLTEHVAWAARMPRRRQPVRWFQNQANDQVEHDIPEYLIKTVSISREMSSDAGQLTVALLNVLPQDNDASAHDPRAAADLHVRGGLTPGRGLGDSSDARDRWAQTPNEWSGTHERHLRPDGKPYTTQTPGWLSPGTLLRTYQGYGGADKTRLQAIADGNLVQTGTWIVDTVDIGHDGQITVGARDTAALLIDQILYPPLVPKGCYPLSFYHDGKRKFAHYWEFNYEDLSDIVILLLLWSGFWLGGAPPNPQVPKGWRGWPAIFGNIEQTGITATKTLGPDLFDKKPVIDAIKQIRDMVSFVTYVDQEGAFHYESGNYYEAGNFLYDGSHTRFAFDIDEQQQLLSYTQTLTKQIDRSQVIVSSADPAIRDENGVALAKFTVFNTNSHTVTNRLHGMQVPMMVPTSIDTSNKELHTMAELIGIRLWFARVNGRSQAAANPLIDINDQVRIWERTTGSYYLHYVKGISTEFDRDSGKYTMDLNTNWVGGDNRDWKIRITPEGHVVYNTPPMFDQFVTNDLKLPIRPTHIGRVDSDLPADVAALVDTPVVE